MTTIAADLTMMVSDRLICDSDAKRRANKIHKVGDAIIGLSDEVRAGNYFLYWYANNRDPRYPIDHVGEFNALVLTKEGLYLYENCYIPEKVQAPYFLGSGSAYARAAYESGKSLPDAVRIATRIDVYSGYGVQVVKL